MGRSTAVQDRPRAEAQARHASQEAPTKDSGAGTRARYDIATLLAYHQASSRPSVTTTRSASDMMQVHPALRSVASADATSTRSSLESSDVRSAAQQAQRSQRLDLSKMFSKNKPAKASPPIDKPQPRRLHSPHAPGAKAALILGEDTRALTMTTPSPSESAARPAPPAAYRHNPYDNAKINIRRPPKGTTHWFDALDSDSDDDFPEVVSTLSDSVSMAASRQSPVSVKSRTSVNSKMSMSSRTAPTSSLVSPMSDTTPDYFNFSYRTRHPSNSVNRNPMVRQVSDKSTTSSYNGFQYTNSTTRSTGLLRHSNDNSILTMSSSEEDDPAGPETPERWHYELAAGNDKHSVAVTTIEDPTSRDAQSCNSVEGVMNTGAASLISDDVLFPTSYPTTHTLANHPVQGVSSTPLTYEANASCPNPTSATTESINKASSGTDLAHMMAVTEEEMLLLDLMRRKRAEALQQQQPSHTHPSLAPVRRTSVNKTLPPVPTAQYLLDSPDGLLFPTPPSNRAAPAAHANPTQAPAFPLPPQAIKELDSTSTPSPLCFISELEAIPYIGPALPRPNASGCEPETRPEQRRRSSSQATTKSGPPPYNAADPYQLAPHLEHESVDLSPLGLGGMGAMTRLGTTTTKSVTGLAKVTELVAAEKNRGTWGL